jgi:hypothetical protein
LPLLFVFLDMLLLFLAIFKRQQPIRVRNRPSKEQRALYPILDRIGKRRGSNCCKYKAIWCIFYLVKLFQEELFLFSVARCGKISRYSVKMIGLLFLV